MAISSSGSVSFAQIRTEYVGGSAAISASQLYRGGSNIPAKASDNQATHLAASVPASGTITFDNFRGTEKGFKYTYSSGATDQNISALFGDDYDLDYPKQVVIDSGVELGATSTTEEALEADTGNGGLAGTLTITNNGTITGRGGAAGQAGGDAFEANVTCTFINNGTVRAGGGGGGAGGAGGRGGNGGQGRYQQASSAWTSWRYQTQGMSQEARVTNTTNQGQQSTYYRWYGTNHGTSWNASSSVYQGIQYQRGTQRGTQYVTEDVSVTGFNIRRYETTYTWIYTSGGGGGAGGAGGAGANGAGYQQTAGTGSNGSGGQTGSNGQTNAGKGGTGGTGGAGGSGGAFGTAGGNGSNGNTGATGNSGNYQGGQGGQAGQSGQSGGAAGNYLRGSTNVTFTNNGTVQGGTVA